MDGVVSLCMGEGGLAGTGLTCGQADLGLRRGQWTEVVGEEVYNQKEEQG